MRSTRSGLAINGRPKLIASATRECAQKDAAPIDDVRSTSSYRRHALQRVLAALLADLGK